MTGSTGTEPKLRDSERYVAASRMRRLWKRSMGLAHGRAQSELLKEQDYEGKPKLHRARDYLKTQVFLWVWHYLKSRFSGKWKFADYESSAGDNGIYSLAAGVEPSEAGQPVRISLIGDWASGTKESQDVAAAVAKAAPHFTVHLGDVYYVGTKQEIRENMLGGKVAWPMGRCGSFALNANHEMYARGKAYFEHLLPELGIIEASGGRQPQRASFFCLKNPYWLVIGLDTGYYSVGLPILEKIKPFKPSARLHSKLMQWLHDDVGVQEDEERGVILLSHHQYYSQFDSGHDRPARQLADLIKRPVLWFWGHEHRLAVYAKHASAKGQLTAYGRCAGHGGLPIEDIGDKPKSDKKHRVGLVLYDRRERIRIGAAKTPVGFNGYVDLTFAGRTLTVEHRDTEKLLVTEKWEVGEGGLLEGTSIELHANDPDLVVYEGATLAQAIE
jgi:hypothetical protein